MSRGCPGVRRWWSAFRALWVWRVGMERGCPCPRCGHGAVSEDFELLCFWCESCGLSGDLWLLVELRLSRANR